jgi:hypothetical protein
MDSTRFPIEMAGELGGHSFLELFEKKPKIIEFVRKLWIEEKCSGMFLDFMKYCKMMLNNPIVKAEHEQRCYKYVTDLKSIPDYMKDYKLKDNEH